MSVMKLCSIALMLVIAACSADEPMDPTGTWDMTVYWATGSCGVSGTTPQRVLVAKSGETYVATTGVAHETTTGSVLSTKDSATIAITINNTDVNNDGGATHAVVTIHATADAQASVVGSGSVAVSGAKTCSQSFSLTGTLL